MKTSLRFFMMLALGLGPAWAADPGAAEWVRKGDALDAQLKTAEALAAYVQADQLDPGNAEILRRIAREQSLSMVDTTSKEEKRRRAEAGLDAAQRAVAADPGNALAQLALGICYGRVAPFTDNKTKIAYSKRVKEHTEKSLKLDPRNDYAYHVLGAWNYELAGLNALLRAAARLIYGEIPAASYEVAVGHFLKAIELAPNRVSHHVELGRTYAALGKKELAKASLEKGLSLPNREKDDPETKGRGREALKGL